MPTVTLNALNVFLMVSENLSISETARVLNLSQPAVSRMVAHVEKYYGTQLFTRQDRGLQLTEEGKLLKEKASQALTELESAENEIYSRRHLNLGKLSIASSHMLTHYYLLDILKNFHKENPSVSIRMENNSILETVRCVLDERVELGIVTTPFGINNGLEFIPFSTMQDCFLAGEEYLSLKRKVVTLKQLSEYPLIVMKEGRITRPYQERCFMSRGAKLKPELECDMMALIADFVASGLGIGWVDRRVAEETIRLHPTLFIVQLDKDLPPRKVGVIKRAGVTLSVAAQAFLKHLRTL